MALKQNLIRRYGGRDHRGNSGCERKNWSNQLLDKELRCLVIGGSEKARKSHRIEVKEKMQTQGGEGGTKN